MSTRIRRTKIFDTTDKIRCSRCKVWKDKEEFLSKLKIKIKKEKKIKKPKKPKKPKKTKTAPVVDVPVVDVPVVDVPVVDVPVVDVPIVDVPIPIDDAPPSLGLDKPVILKKYCESCLEVATAYRIAHKKPKKSKKAIVSHLSDEEKQELLEEVNASD
jgi:hypothetical protein